MTPNSVLGFKDTEFPEFRGYAEDIRTYNRYKDSESLIAYRKCFLGIVMVIRGARDFFGFLILNKELDSWNTMELKRRPLNDIIKMFQLGGTDNLVVIDSELYKVFERKVLYKGLIENE